MQQRLEMMLDQALERNSTPLAKIDRKWHPPVDAFESDEEFVVIVDLAGVPKDSINITYQEPDLHISGTRTGARAAGKIKFHQMEINYGPFERIIRIEASVQADEIRAQYKDGFLFLHIPRNQKRKVIEVKTEE
jgi:HSP20 family protein